MTSHQTLKLKIGNTNYGAGCDFELSDNENKKKRNARKKIQPKFRKW